MYNFNSCHKWKIQDSKEQYIWIIVESGVKQHSPSPPQDSTDFIYSTQGPGATWATKYTYRNTNTHVYAIHTFETNL